MTEAELLVDCVRRLNRVGVDYLLTGSMASNYWGVPRTTHDLDFVVQMPPAAMARLVEEFAADYYIDADAVRGAYAPPFQFNAIDTRSALKIDFWLLQPAPFDRMLFGRRLAVSLFGERTWLATAEDIILHKLVWNRISPSERQLGDAAGVVAVQAERLDREYLHDWAAQLGVSDVLGQLLSGVLRPKKT